jgi:hypothetical protein
VADEANERAVFKVKTGEPLKAKGLAGESLTGSQTTDFARKRIESGKEVSAVSIIPAEVQHMERQIGVF